MQHSFKSTFKPINKETYSPEATLSTSDSPNLSPAVEYFQPENRVPFKELQLNQITPDKLPLPREH